LGPARFRRAEHGHGDLPVLDGRIVRARDDHAVAARRLRRVERAVGLPEQAGRVAAVLDQVGDADAHGDGPLDALHADRGDHVADPLGERQRFLGGRLGQQHEQLFAAEAPGEVARPQARPQRRAHRGQHLVALGVAEAVVDLLEVVEVLPGRLRCRCRRTSSWASSSPAVTWRVSTNSAWSAS